jgi:hypothetical protein
LNLRGNPIRSIRQSVVNGPVGELLRLLRSRLPEGEDGDTERGAFGGSGDGDDRSEKEVEARRVVFAASNARRRAWDDGDPARHERGIEATGSNSNSKSNW